eukprot:5134047-Alexandrium_andersonii.AAC.1
MVGFLASPSVAQAPSAPLALSDQSSQLCPVGLVDSLSLASRQGVTASSSSVGRTQLSCRVVRERAFGKQQSTLRQGGCIAGHRGTWWEAAGSIRHSGTWCQEERCLGASWHTAGCGGMP